MNISEMQPQKNSKPSLTTPSQNASAGPQKNSVEEARQVNKLRMLLNAVKAVRNEPEEMPEWMEKAPIIYRRKG